MGVVGSDAGERGKRWNGGCEGTKGQMIGGRDQQSFFAI